MSQDINDDKVAELCVQLVRHARDCGDSVYLMKMLAVACSTGLDGVQRPGESIEASAGSLLLTSLAVCAVELGMPRDRLLAEVGRAFDVVQKKMEQARARRSLFVVPGGVA